MGMMRGNGGAGRIVRKLLECVPVDHRQLFYQHFVLVNC